ncbi:MAG: DUF2878 domain-containing protein [Xanthomonadales bacterium]|nr:hypothetical protein [Xanthomonadales bacterium]MCC6594681.1 DUF2878 domain-containing protein [Xanthomonadales bacterium]
MSIWLNLVLFQLGWVATVAGAGLGYWWAGPLSLLVLAAVVFRLTPWPRTDLALLCAACLLGLVIDSAYLQFGLLRFAEPVPFDGLAPIWILGMWMSFALTLNHSMRFFQGRPIATGLLGLVGGPLAYWVAGSKFAAVEMLGDTRIGYAAIGIVWGLVTPLLVALASRWLPEFDPRKGRPA